MAYELYHTSAPKGLRPHTTGFCTVAMTTGMSASMVQKLEGMGGYRPVYNVGDPNAWKNPPVFAHWCANIGGQAYDILSRISYAGADHQGRFNKLAHHLILERRPSSGGPGGVASLGLSGKP